MHVTRCTYWPQHLQNGYKCNNDVNLTYVANHRACQTVAEGAGHPYYSFQRSATNGQHKCFSSETCEEPIPSNKWHMYVAPNPSLNDRLKEYLQDPECAAGLNLLSVNR